MLLRHRNKAHYHKHKEAARMLVVARLAYFNSYYQLPVGKVFIKNTKSRWGSCSRKGNLNFNYKILLLPQPLQDYLVVHELCHLAEFNHGQKFWARVAEAVPNYRLYRKHLRAL